MAGARPKRAVLKRKSVKRARAAKPQRKEFARWSARVMQRGDALDLESGLFKKRSARQVARSLKAHP
jgi:hypothetical protein